MLQLIHERIKGWVAWLIVVLIGFTFILFGANYYVSSRGTQTNKIEVDGVAITEQDYQSLYNRLLSQAGTSSDIKELKQKVVDQLVEQVVISKSATDNGFYISEAQVQSQILSIPQFQQDGHFTTERFQQVLAQSGYTTERFFEQVRKGMLTNQQQFSFVASDFILPSELKRIYSYLGQKRDYRFMVLKPTLFINAVQINEQAIKDYYQTHQAQFMSPEQVSIEYVTLDANNLKLDASINTKLAKQYYLENVANFTQPAEYQFARILLSEQQDKEKLVHRIIKEANSGVDFSKLISTYSMDKFTSKKKPSWVKATALSEPLLSELAKAKVDEVRGPIATTHGVEVIKLIAKKSQKVQPFTEVEQKIKQQLGSERRQAKFVELGEQLTDLSYQEPDSLAPVAQSLNLSIEHTPLFSLNSKINTGLMQNDKVRQAAFSQEVLQEGLNSQPIQLNANKVVVIRIKEHKKAQLKKLKQVQSEIVTILKKEKASELAYQKANEAAQAMRAGQPATLDKILAQYSLSWHEKKQAQLFNASKDYQINKLAFNMPTELLYQASQLIDGSAVVIQLQSVKKGNINNLSQEEQQALEQDLAQAYGMRSFNAYIESLLRSAKVQLN